MATQTHQPVPQAGDEAWLLEQNIDHWSTPRTLPNQIPSFLRQPTFLSGAATTPATSFLNYHYGKEQPERLEPRTIASENPYNPRTTFLRVPRMTASKLHSPTMPSADISATAKSCPPHLREKNGLPGSTANTESLIDSRKGIDIRSSGGPTARKGVPPHLRKKIERVDSAFCESRTDLESSTDIRTKLSEDHGVKVSEPSAVQPIGDGGIKTIIHSPVNQSRGRGGKRGRGSRGRAISVQSPTELSKDHAVQNGEPKRSSPNARGRDGGVRVPANGSKGRDAQNGEPKRGSPNHRGRGGRGRGGQPRGSSWIKNSELKADPKKHDMQWDTKDEWGSIAGSVDSLCADAGWGDNGNKKKQHQQRIDPETGFKLANWDGQWAPAPVDWDARPAYRNDQSTGQIEAWMNKIDDAMLDVKPLVNAEHDTKWAIPMEDIVVDGTSYYFAPDPKKPDVPIMGDPAPRYWIPGIMEEGKAPSTYWNMFVLSNTPKSTYAGDLDRAMPWWQTYQLAGGYSLKPNDAPSIKGFDPREETEAEKLARENDFGGAHATENRKRFELAKQAKHRDEEKQVKKNQREYREKHHKELEKIVPGVKIYIRSAKFTDVKQLMAIYNYYVDFSVSVPDIECLDEDEMWRRVGCVTMDGLPFLVACERPPKGQRKKNKVGEFIEYPEKIIGFACAGDYHHDMGMYRFAAEVEVYTEKSCYMKNVANCLLDKILAIVDPKHPVRGGYEYIGQDIIPSRTITNLIIQMPYDKHKPDNLEWKGRWLTQSLDFKKVGDLDGIGLKDGKTVSLAIFQRATGAVLDPENPPPMKEYAIEED